MQVNPVRPFFLARGAGVTIEGGLDLHQRIDVKIDRIIVWHLAHVPPVSSLVKFQRKLAGFGRDVSLMVFNSSRETG